MATPREKLSRLLFGTEKSFLTKAEREAAAKSGTPSPSPAPSPSGTSSGRPRDTVMGSSKNVDVGRGRGTVTPPAAKPAPKATTPPPPPAPKFKTEKVDISTGGEYDTKGAGMAGTPGGAAAERSGKTSYYGDSETPTVSETPSSQSTKFEDESSKPFWSRFKKGGSVKKMAGGGKVSSASKRADGCAQRGKTRGKVV